MSRCHFWNRTVNEDKYVKLLDIISPWENIVSLKLELQTLREVK